MKNGVTDDEDGHGIEMCFMFWDSIKEVMELLSTGQVADAKNMISVIESFMGEMIEEHFESIKIAKDDPVILNNITLKHHAFTHIDSAN